MIVASADGRLAVVGYGYWGPNVVRNVIENRDLRLIAVCETQEARAPEFNQPASGLPCTSDLDEVLNDPAVEAVVHRDPAGHPPPLASRALNAGKHVLVEKPLAMSVTEAEDLIVQAAALDRVLMPGHTFLYSPPVNKVRELIQGGELGETYFVTSSRMNLGMYHDGGVILDLAPHDISILLHWLASPVVQVSAAAQSSSTRDPRDGVSDPQLRQRGDRQRTDLLAGAAQGRQMVVVGSKRMVITTTPPPTTGPRLRPGHGRYERPSPPTSASTSSSIEPATS